MTIEALNAFCVDYAKLVEACSAGKKNTEEAYQIIRRMRINWELLDGKEAHFLERYTVKLADMGYYNAPAPTIAKVDISDLEFDDSVDASGQFKHASKMVKNNAGHVYAAYNYNEYSVPLSKLPANERDEIMKKFQQNMKNTADCIADPSKTVYTKRRLTSPKLKDSERDW
jgi:hypothetical protein